MKDSEQEISAETVTFYVIRAKKDFGNTKYPDDIYAFKAGWYAANEFVKPFKNAKFFATKGKASRYLKTSNTLGFAIVRDEYF